MCFLYVLVPFILDIFILYIGQMLFRWIGAADSGTTAPAVWKVQLTTSWQNFLCTFRSGFFGTCWPTRRYNNLVNMHNIQYYIWYMNIMHDIWYMIYYCIDLWYMIFDIWYMIYDIWYLIRKYIYVYIMIGYDILLFVLICIDTYW